jgi:hypothetical protein
VGLGTGDTFFPFLLKVLDSEILLRTLGDALNLRGYRNAGAVQNSAGYSVEQKFQNFNRTKNSDVQLVSLCSPKANADIATS